MKNFQMRSITFLELQENPQTDFERVLAECNLLRLELLDGSIRELTKPKLGREIVSGDLEDGMTLGFFRRSTIKSIEFDKTPGLTGATVAYTRKAFGELLARQVFPTLAKLSFLEQPASIHLLRPLGVSRGFLVVSNPQTTAIPLASIGYLELSCE